MRSNWILPALLLIGLNFSVQAQETLKERLSDKASDEQRVNNCKVPMDRRGATPRPENCGTPQPAKDTSVSSASTLKQ